MAFNENDIPFSEADSTGKLKVAKLPDDAQAFVDQIAGTNADFAQVTTSVIVSTGTLSITDGDNNSIALGGSGVYITGNDGTVTLDDGSSDTIVVSNDVSITSSNGSVSIFDAGGSNITLDGNGSIFVASNNGGQSEVSTDGGQAFFQGVSCTVSAGVQDDGTVPSLNGGGFYINQGHFFYFDASGLSATHVGTLPNATGIFTLTSSVPGSATATGVVGQIAVASGFIYVCVAANTWQRAVLTTF